MTDVDESNSNPAVSSSSAGKHIYFPDEEEEEEEDQAKPTENTQIIERENPSTIRVDSSDLINRCKDILPLLSSSSNVNERVNIEEEEDDDLPERSSKESGEASSSTEDEKEMVKKKRKKKKKKKKKKAKIMDDVNQADPILEK